MKRLAPPLVFAAALCSSCGGEASEVKTERARPVTVYELQESAPPPGRLIPGVVTPFRQTQIPFQVGGTVTRLIDEGDDLVGEQLDQKGQVTQQGSVIAEIDAAPLQRALVQAEQRLAAARKELDAQVVQLKTVLPARLESARSQSAAAELSASYARDDVQALTSAVELAETTLKRNQELLPTGAVSDIAVRESETNVQTQRARLAQARTLVTTREREYDSAMSAVAELEGNLALQEATNEARRASIKELEEAVLDAKSNLEDCVLRAPFPGRVTELHVGEGSFVRAGDPIITLTMMNPILAEISVSAQVEEQLVVGTDAFLYPMSGNAVDLERGLRATLYNKSGVADSGTRTFQIGLIAANRRQVERAETERGKPTAPYLIPIFDNPMDLPGGSALYTVADAIYGSGDDAWVLKVDGLTQGGRTAETLKGELQAKRVPVRIGARNVQIASFLLVELISSELSTGDLLVPYPTPGHEQGFVLDDNRWLLRPGDLVQVAVDHGELPGGFYVPVQAIRERNGEQTLFVVGDDDVANSISVEVAESSGELRRVLSSELQAGAMIVCQGAHFLQDGDQVIRTGVEEVQ